MLRIIHLSDFHLNKNNVSDWNSYVKDALFKLLKDKIDINTTISYDINLNKVVSCSIDCPTKEASRTVLDLLPEDFSKKVNIPITI